MRKAGGILLSSLSVFHPSHGTQAVDAAAGRVMAGRVLAYSLIFCRGRGTAPICLRLPPGCHICAPRRMSSPYCSLSVFAGQGVFCPPTSTWLELGTYFVSRKQYRQAMSATNNPYSRQQIALDSPAPLAVDNDCIEYRNTMQSVRPPRVLSTNPASIDQLLAWSSLTHLQTVVINFPDYRTASSYISCRLCCIVAALTT